MSQDFPQQPYKPPTAYGAPNNPQGDSTGGVIPYKNAPALIAYYLGIFSMIPCLGLVFAIPALILGIIGLQKRKQNPAVKGSAHAWIGIVLGAICTLLWGGGIIFMVLASTVR